MRWLMWGLFALVLWTVVGCGGGPTGPVERTEPMPKERFPREKR